MIINSYDYENDGVDVETGYVDDENENRDGGDDDDGNISTYKANEFIQVYLSVCLSVVILCA